jgi:hypothetical protein
MTNEQCDISHHIYLKRISWSAIVVGALVGTGLSLLLNLFSVAIGLSVVRTTHDGLVSLAVGGFIGLLIGAIVAMFVAGFTAGYLGQPYTTKRNLGIIYGFTTWCLALILTILLASHVGRYVTSYSAFITNPTAVVFTNNQISPAVTTTNTNTSNLNIVVNAQAATNNLGYTAFLIFILFFVGAISSCFGGHYGVICRTCKYCREDGNTPNTVG